VANPLINITLQGRHDSYPKRRGMTRVPELMAAGVNVAFGHDCVMDPWYSLGSGDMLEVASMGLHVAQMTGLAAMRRCFDAVTVNAARVLGLAGYGLEVGARADMVLLQARSPEEAIRLRADAPGRWCVAAGSWRAVRRPRWPCRCRAGPGSWTSRDRPPDRMVRVREDSITMPSMKLIGSPTSPYVRKVRVVMAEKKLDFQLAFEDPWAADVVLKSNPLGKVPCLVMEGGEAVFDSRVIVEYLDTVAGGQADPGQRPRTRRGAHLGGPGRRPARRCHRSRAGSHLVGPCRRRAFAGLDRPPDEPRAHHAEGDEPGPGRQALVRTATSFTLADVATGCALGYLDFRFPQIDWRGSHPNLVKLYDKLAARQSFIDSAPPKPSGAPPGSSRAVEAGARASGQYSGRRCAASRPGPRWPPAAAPGATCGSRLDSRRTSLLLVRRTMCEA
jgi:glutathione S-transferase